MTIRIAHDEEEVRQCYRVMKQLRTHLSESEYQHQVQMQRGEGYAVVYLEEEGVIKSVAGYRIMHTLAWGKCLYVDDLVTESSERSKGYGKQLFEWLVRVARDAGCDQFHLDSGVQRFGAHKFYLGMNMQIRSHHFSMTLK